MKVQICILLFSALSLSVDGIAEAFSFRSQNLPSAQVTLIRSQPWHLSSPVADESPAVLFSSINDPQLKPHQDQRAPSLLAQLLTSHVGAFAVLAGVALFHESGHYLLARSVGVRPEEFSVGFGPKLLGFDLLGDSFSLRALPIGGYVSFPSIVLRTLPWQERVLITGAGVAFNLLLAVVIYTHQILHGAGLQELLFERGAVVSALTGPDAAARGKLREGDVIFGVNGAPVSSWSHTISVWEAEKAISDIIATVQATPDGEAIEFSVRRLNKSKPFNVSIKPQHVSPVSGKAGLPTVGVYLEPNVVGTTMLKLDSAIEATITATRHVLDVTWATAVGFAVYTRDLITRQVEASEYRVSGPMGVIQKASDVVATHDWDTVQRFVAVLSVNLAVLNMLPVPPSDGFQILYTLGDAIMS